MTYRLKPGDLAARQDGAWAEVLAVTDGDRLRVRYTGEGHGIDLAGTEDTWDAGEVWSFSPAPPGPAWGDQVTVVVHHIPESEETEGGYEAVTMSGVPLGISVSTGEMETAQEALDRLLSALSIFGFAGTVGVEDTTYIGSVQHFDIEVS